MMEFNLRPTIPAVLVTLLTLAPLYASAPDRVGAYDFSYQSSGDHRVRPAQVFDDGKSTYFQFRPGESLPAIFAETAQGPVILMPEMEGPYVRVPSVGSGFILRLGLGYGRIAYVGSARAEGVPAGTPELSAGERVATERLLAASSEIQGLPAEMLMPTAAPRVALEVNSYATPLSGDRTEWTTNARVSPTFDIPFVQGTPKPKERAIKAARAFAASNREAQKIIVTGIDDKSFKEGLAEQRARAVTELLVSAGIARDRIVIEHSGTHRDGEGDNVVIGATLVSHTSRSYTPAPAPVGGTTVNLASVAGDQDVNRIVASLRAGHITAAQAAAALDRSRSLPHTRAVTPQSGLATPVAGQPINWEVRASDSTFANMIKRWGEASGWRVEVKSAPEIRINGDDSFKRPDFLTAADYAVTQAKKAGFRIAAVAYSNNVLVITEEKQ